MHVVSTLEAIAALFVGGKFILVNFQVQYLKIKLKTTPLYAGSYNIVYNSMVVSTQILADRFIFWLLRISIWNKLFCGFVLLALLFAFTYCSEESSAPLLKPPNVAQQTPSSVPVCSGTSVNVYEEIQPSEKKWPTVFIIVE